MGRGRERVVETPTCVVFERSATEGRGSEAPGPAPRKLRGWWRRPGRLVASISSSIGAKPLAGSAGRLMPKSLQEDVEYSARRKRSPHKPAAISENARLLSTIAQVPKPAYFFAAGAVAGALGKTFTAPLDRVKVLLQVKGGYTGSLVQEAAASGRLLPAFRAILREEGFRSLWRGNVPQVLRVLPYSAIQLSSYEEFKKVFKCEDATTMAVPRRLAAGACAGMIATLVTYPLDTVRLRMAVDTSIKSMPQAYNVLIKEGGKLALYRGVGPAIVGVAPYMALELASFDLIKRLLRDKDGTNQASASFVSGFAAALMASSFTYPLDTIRRQIQLRGGSMLTVPRTFKDTWAAEGIRGLYRGFVPSNLKNMPNKAIRLSTYDAAKVLMAASEEAAEKKAEETRAAGKKRGRKRL